MSFAYQSITLVALAIVCVAFIWLPHLRELRRESESQAREELAEGSVPQERAPDSPA